MSTRHELARFAAILDALERLGIPGPDASFDDIEAALARASAEVLLPPPLDGAPELPTIPLGPRFAVERLAPVPRTGTLPVPGGVS